MSCFHRIFLSVCIVLYESPLHFFIDYGVCGQVLKDVNLEIFTSQMRISILLIPVVLTSRSEHSVGFTRYLFVLDFGQIFITFLMRCLNTLGKYFGSLLSTILRSCFVCKGKCRQNYLFSFIHPWPAYQFICSDCMPGIQITCFKSVSGF